MTGELDDWLAAWPLVWRVYLAGSVTLTERAGAPRPQFEIKYSPRVILQIPISNATYSMSWVTRCLPEAL